MPTPRRAGEIDPDRPSAARIYDYYLGGSRNFGVDREFARRAIELWPELPRMMQANRAFLQRAVRYLVGRGITQFLDLGSGIPTVGNVHEVAQAERPDARVLYVDIDPVAATLSATLLADDPNTAILQADLRDVDAVLRDPVTTRLLDLDRPVAVMMIAVLHFVPDADDPAAIVSRYRRALAPGSHLALSHATRDAQPDQADSHISLYQQTGTPMTMRSRTEIAAVVAGFDPVAPGIVFIPQWRPDESHPDGRTEPERHSGYAVVGRRTDQDG